MPQNQITKTAQIDMQKYLNYFFIAYTFSFPLSKGATSILSFLILILWIWDGNFKTKLHILNQSIFIKMLSLLLAFSFISIIWSSHTPFVAEYLQKYWHFLLIPIIYTSFDKKYFNHILVAFILSMIISSFIMFGVIGQVLSFTTAFPDSPNPFMDHTSCSIFLAFSIFATLYQYQNSVDLRWKRFYFVSSFILILALLLSGGRTGQVGFIFVLLLMIIFYSKRRMITLVSLFLPIIIGMGIFYNVNNTFNLRFGALIDDTKNLIVYQDFSGGGFGARASLWIMGLHKFAENPIIGSGIGNEGINATYYAKLYNFPYWQEIDETNTVDYHNVFIQYAVQLGIVGFLLFTFTLWSLFRLQFTTTYIHWLHITFVLLFVFLSLGGHTFHLRNSMVFFVIFSSIFATIARIEQEQQSHNS